MVNVALLNLEPKYKNYALEKLRIYHTQKGDMVEDYMPLNYPNYDKIYCSSIFTFTPKKNLPPNIITGGSGFDLDTNLPDDVDAIKPHLNFGFTTRGCIRNCKFCIVPKKEGNIKVVGDLLDLWNGRERFITIMDNNILALPDHFALICKQARENKIKLDFNQGLDHRLLTPEIVRLMASISHSEYRFAFDHPSYLPTVKRAIQLLKDFGINRSNWYVLVGFDTTPAQDLERLNYLRDMGQRAYVQRYRTHFNEPFYVGLARWVNQPNLFAGMTWQEFLDYPRADHKRLKESIGEMYD